MPPKIERQSSVETKSIEARVVIAILLNVQAKRDLHIREMNDL